MDREPSDGEDDAPLPPHSSEAEQCVLGCILVDPEKSAACMMECVTRLKAGSKVFFELRHRHIYDQMLEMYEENRAIDLVTLRQEMADMLRLEGIGGVAYLASLPAAVPSVESLPHYLGIVIEKFSIRTIRQGCMDLVEKIASGAGADVAIAAAEVLIQEAAAQFQDVTTLRKVSELAPKAQETIELLHTNKGVIIGVPTGLASVDALTRGLKPGEVFVVAGRTSSGKSAYGLNIAERVAVDYGLPVGFISLEMTSDSLMLRMMCSRGKVNMNRIIAGECDETDFAKLAAATAALNAAPLYIDDEAGISLTQLKAKARRMRKVLGVGLIVIDYLQLLHVATKTQNRQEEVAALSRGIRQLAKELGIPIVLLAQLNRDVEKGGDRKPRLSDLRESGQIENDADIVGILHPKKNGPEGNEDSPDTFIKIVSFILCKHRNGPTGEVQLMFYKPYTRFDDAT